jgi:hypothetical protein
MREGLDAPTWELPAERVAEIRSFLDGQSRIRLAVWVRHRLATAEPLYDHHLVLGVSDEDWVTGDMWALEEGAQLPPLGTGTWLDIYPESEVGALRAFGTVLWEQAAAGPDPLDYRFTHEPFAPDPAAAERFTDLLSADPGIRRVGALVERLWKGDDSIKETVQLTVEARPGSDVLQLVHDAARETVVVGVPASGATLGSLPAEAIILYEVAG